MITGFGNNTVSALASDITATQTTFSVIPGAGEKFEQLLTTGNVNAGSPHSVYAKLTLTDSQGTVFEICHLTKVAVDTLTVIRGQEGTTAKGWSLNDIVANFATRGSEESFVQIEQLQGGDFTSATAGGTPNALTIALPSTYMNNGSNDWALQTPLMIMPIAANSGAVTIQVTLAGKVVGTFPAYKGNKAVLEAGDVLTGVPFICVMDSAKTFFTVINPVKIYSKLGTAAFRDVQTSKDDVTPGRVLANGGAIATRSYVAKGDAGGNTTDVNDLPSNSVSFVYASALNSPGFESSVLDFSGFGGAYNVQFAASYVKPSLFKIRTKNGDNGNWNQWDTVYTTSYKPTANDVGAVPTSGGDVSYLNNSAHFSIKPGSWEGAGGFSSQYTNPISPFIVPLYLAPKDVSIYFPVVKGITSASGYGYSSAVSFGVLRSGSADFGTAIIHLIGDNGVSHEWSFNPVTGGISNNSVGSFSTQTDAQSRADAAYNNAIDWVKSQFSLNFTSSGWWHRDITGKITQGGTVIGNGGFVNTTFPIAFPNQCLQVQMTLANGVFDNSKDNIFANIISNTAFQAVMHPSEYGAYWLAEGY